MLHLRRPLPRQIHWGVGIAALITAAILDYFVGPEFILAIVYLIPTLYVAWFLGRKYGLLIATLSWLLAVHNAGVFTGMFTKHLQGDVVDITVNAVTALIFFLLTAWLTAELRNKQNLLQQWVNVDHITGAATSRRFYELTETELYRLSRYHHPLSIAYLDIDNFKHINDTFGHAEGDALLKAVAETIGQEIRASDCIARLGGDEFAVLLPETPSDAVHKLMTKINASLNQRMQQAQWPVSFSIGVLTCLHPAPIGEVLRRADALMYQAKNSGKNMTVFESI